MGKKAQNNQLNQSDLTVRTLYFELGFVSLRAKMFYVRSLFLNDLDNLLSAAPEQGHTAATVTVIVN